MKRGRKIFGPCLTIFLIWTAAVCAAAQEPAPLASSRGGHLLIQLVYDGNSLEVADVVQVASGLPLRRAQALAMPWRFSVIGKDGRELFGGFLPDPTVLRGEFADPRDPNRIEAYHLTVNGPASFVIRVPYVAGERIEFYLANRAQQAISPGAKPGKDALIGSVTYPTRDVDR